MRLHSLNIIEFMYKMREQTFVVFNLHFTKHNENLCYANERVECLHESELYFEALKPYSILYRRDDVARGHKMYVSFAMVSVFDL